MAHETGTVTLHDVEYTVSHDDTTGILTVLTAEKMVGMLNAADLEPAPEAVVVETEPIVDTTGEAA